eukprot:gene21648-28012_t
MDGFAVKAPLNKGIYTIKDKIFAGEFVDTIISDNNNYVSYITTGAKLPDWANAVVKIEDTETVKDNHITINNQVNIKVDVSIGTHVRQIGSDIKQNEIILKKGQKIGPAEVGLLATIGYTHIPCYYQPIIGIMSTGNELVEYNDIPLGSQIRDSNRPTLISAFKEDGYQCIDLGIARDNEQELTDYFIDAASRCDIVISSGGVSMGEKDLVKPLLSKLGIIHFGRLNMKPGKPTTFATIHVHKKKILFFGLPGNPVSCLVTKSLLIDPALKRVQGLDSNQCMHTQVQVYVSDIEIQLDPERPEYHRMIVSYDYASNKLIAKSTGNQRSSRLLSMSSANALICLPAGTGTVKPGALVTALLLRPIAPPSYNNCFHKKSATLDFNNIPSNSLAYESFDNLISKTPPVDNVAKDKGLDWRTIRVAILTISDRAYEGVYKDESGPEVSRLLDNMSQSNDWPLVTNTVYTSIVPDDIGFGTRDLTPEAIKPLLHRESPGISQALLNEGLKYTNLAVLSRPISGTRHNTFICTLPGSVKAVKENINALKPLLPRIMELIKSGTCSK